MQSYTNRKKCQNLPRLPLEGFLDITYRCNNNCRHCWLWTPNTAEEASKELAFEEIKRIVGEARSMGCRSWSISGGEPMLRDDFPDIFDFITNKSASYSINTNGTLITPAIARLMKRKGKKMVAIYGATADVHDHITRTPGSFEAVMRGFAYLKEAGAGFMVQIIPMKDNYHQLNDMMKLAETLSPYRRIGAAWLYLSALGNPKKNQEIASQRLAHDEVVELDKPDICFEEALHEEEGYACRARDSDDLLFAACIENRRDFHIDPYGQLSFCCFVKDLALRFDLKKGTFIEGWEAFIPSLAVKVRGGREYLENCGTCELKRDCRWCGVYGFLENRRFSAKVNYLCDIAKATKVSKDKWKKDHRRFFRMAGITIQIDADLPLDDTTFDKALKTFEVYEPGDDTITIRHHFSMPDLNNKDLGQQIYNKPPWIIYRKHDAWIYLVMAPFSEGMPPHQLAIFNKEHTRATIFNRDASFFKLAPHNSLCLFPTDQIVIARALADRKAFYLHSAGVILDGCGLLFAGHSEAGKSTMVKMLRTRAEVLCDDRNIVRKWGDGVWKVHGTWSHGEIPEVSSNSAPLRAIIFLEKADENRLIKVEDRGDIIKSLIDCVIKPAVDADWWKKTLQIIEAAGHEIPCFRLKFDKSGDVVPLIEKLINMPVMSEK